MTILPRWSPGMTGPPDAPEAPNALALLSSPKHRSSWRHCYPRTAKRSGAIVIPETPSALALLSSPKRRRRYRGRRGPQSRPPRTALATSRGEGGRARYVKCGPTRAFSRATSSASMRVWSSGKGTGGASRQTPAPPWGSAGDCGGRGRGGWSGIWIDQNQITWCDRIH